MYTTTRRRRSSVIGIDDEDDDDDDIDDSSGNNVDVQMDDVEDVNKYHSLKKTKVIDQKTIVS